MNTLPNGKRVHMEQAVDITEAEHARIALREASERVKLLLDATPFCCMLWDWNRTVIDCNEALLKLFGLPDKTALGTWFFECSPEYQPDGRRSDEKALTMVDRAFDGESCVFEWIHQAMDGTPIPVEVTLSPIRQENFFVVAGYARDLRKYRSMSREVERRNSLLRGVNDVSATMLRTDTHRFEADLLHSMDILGKSAGIDRVYIWKNHARDGRLYCSQIYEWAAGVEPQQDKEYAVESAYDDVPGWEAAFLERRCINSIVRDLSAEERLLLCPQGILSILLVPIFIKDVFWGFIGFDDCQQERRFAEGEEDILRFASDMIANALIRNEEAAAIREADARAYGMLQAQAHWYKSILDATPLPVSVTDAKGRWTFVNKAVENFLGMRSEDLLGKPCSEWNSHICNTDACGIACVKRGIRQTFFDQDGMSYQVDVGILRSLEGESTGFVEIVQDITEVKDMARRQMDMANSIVHLQSEVEKNSYDPLTGCYSRRFFEETLDRLMHTLSRSHGTLSLMMVDIDYFKQYNDTYGHLKGDDCLKTVAESLRSCMLRKDDFVARYGGEEFVVVLPNTDEDGARIIADKMLKDIRRHAVLHAKSAVAGCVTISIGAVSGRVMHTHGIADFLQRADELLYASKQGGRNRYTFARL